MHRQLNRLFLLQRLLRPIWMTCFMREFKEQPVQPACFTNERILLHLVVTSRISVKRLISTARLLVANLSSANSHLHREIA